MADKITKQQLEKLENEFEYLSYELRKMINSGIQERINILKRDPTNEESVAYHNIVDRRYELGDRIKKAQIERKGSDKYNLRHYLSTGETLLIPREVFENDPQLKRRIRYSGYRIAEYERTKKNRNIHFKMRTKSGTCRFWFERG